MSDLRISLPNPCRERWDEMQPAGCNRFCSTCSETIHDLSELTAQEAEVLLRKAGQHCVRAKVVGPDGALALKPSRLGNQRKILVAVGASISLLTSGCETLPQASSPMGLIVGKVDPRSGVKSVTAISYDGRTYRTKVFGDGSYRFKQLPYGPYSLKFIDDCGGQNGAQVNLQESEHSVEEPPLTVGCIVIGMVKIEDNHA